MAHPRLYWGETGNNLTPALLELPISRNHRHGGWQDRVPFFGDPSSPVSANRNFDLFNQNGWGRSLHFLAAWFVVVPGAIYLLAGIVMMDGSTALTCSMLCTLRLCSPTA
jgi:hypothetical protein